MGLLRWVVAAAIVPAFSILGCDNAFDPPPHSGESALADARAQVAMGPRVPGTPAHREARAWIVSRLEEAGGVPAVQAVVDTGFPLPEVDTLYNVQARFGPPNGPYLLLGAHYDTRPWADQDPDPVRHDTPVPGGNDGASGVAVLLEVARACAQRPPPLGVVVAFFDGEDAGRSDRPEDFCRGSRAFVRRLPHPYPLHVIIVDMVGRPDATFHPEGNSQRAVPSLVDRLWSGAGKVRAESFQEGVRHFVYDDHVPFIEAGIPAADIIDLDDPAWHTTGDDADNLDAGTLEEVIRVLLWHVYTLEVEAP